MVDSVAHKVDVMIDLSRSPDLPENALWYLRRLHPKHQPITRQVIFIGTSVISHAIIAMFK